MKALGANRRNRQTSTAWQAMVQPVWLVGESIVAANRLSQPTLIQIANESVRTAMQSAISSRLCTQLFGVIP